MKSEQSESQAATALELITNAFSNRVPPLVLTDSMQLTDCEYTEVMSYQGLGWQDVTFAQVKQNPDAVFWFSPEAFCYYLPGILAPGLRENRWDSNAYDSLIGCLDRSPVPDYWDDFFLPRWPLLSAQEIDAVAAWVKWLAIVQPDEIYGNVYERVQDTLNLLKRMIRDGEAPDRSDQASAKRT
jgi:hypothetical protein